MKIKNGIMLVLTAFIWGTAFVAQSVGMDYLGPFTFNGVRSLIGGAALLPCIWLRMGFPSAAAALFLSACLPVHSPPTYPASN